MPKAYPEAYVQNDVIVAPEEINREVTAALGVFNGGMDRDNLIQRRVTAIMVESGTFHEMLVDEQTAASQTLVIAGGHQSGQWDHVPDAAGDPWIKRVTTEDCVLDIVLSVDVRNAASSTVEMGIRVDGVIYAISGPFNARTANTRQLEATVPLGAGLHVVEAVFMLVSSLLAGTNTNVFRGRAFFVRECKR